jgi:hypothetical protein
VIFWNEHIKQLPKLLEVLAQMRLVSLARKPSNKHRVPIALIFPAHDKSEIIIISEKWAVDRVEIVEDRLDVEVDRLLSTLWAIFWQNRGQKH